MISDTHFGHTNICGFVRQDGTPLRPWRTIEEMDEALIENWNAVVAPGDKVYHLGDVAIPRKGLKCLASLNGTKILIRGNHDIFKLTDYTEYFKDVRGCHYLDKLVLTHIPVHPDNLARWKGNVHGHLHARRILLPDGTVDARYECVCVEHTNFAPIDFELVKSRFD